MMKIDLIGRIRRTMQCRIRHYNIRKMQLGDPMKFYEDPERYLKMVYASCYGSYPDFKHFDTFNIQLLKLNISALNDPIQHKLRVRCADKYLVREYVKSKGFEDILIPCYGVFDSFDEIDFDKLPNQFVIQTNFGCGQIWLCRDKKSENIDKWRVQFNKWMSIEHFGLRTGEWHYGEIPHKLIITKYLQNIDGESIRDYKFHCFHGHVYGCQVVYDRMFNNSNSIQVDHYDRDWNLTNYLNEDMHVNQKEISKPITYLQMLDVASVLSKDFPYCRVDLYEINGNVYFGELTFTPEANLLCSYKNETLIDMLNFYQLSK